VNGRGVRNNIHHRIGVLDDFSVPQDQMVTFTQTVRPEVYIDVESHEMCDRLESKQGVFDGSQAWEPSKAA
jgi:hypothetical protein